MDYHLQFDKLCEKLKLGPLTAEPLPLSGGHMHRMFLLKTATGRYAVKALNPGVMQRPEAMGNLINAESIAQAAVQSLPAIACLVFDASYIQEVEGQYYCLYPFIEGKTLASGALTVQHAQRIGTLLAGLHQIDFSGLKLTDDYSYREALFDWDFYLQRGIDTGAAWTDLIKANIEKLYIWNDRLIKAAARLSCGTVISHCDLEPKNVMWQGDHPIVIDWEAAGFVHPAFDLVETAIYWAKDSENNIQKDRLTAFIRAYKAANPTLATDLDPVLDKGFARLGWLDYSFKRSLGIECADEAERQMGTEHVIWSIDDLLQYEKMLPTLKEWMQEVI